MSDANELNLKRLIPDIEMFDAELERRLNLVPQIFASKLPDGLAQTVTLSFDKVAAKELDHFERAAFAVVHAQMQQLEQLTRALFNSAAAINGNNQLVTLVQPQHKPETVFLLDSDRLANTCRFLTVLWIAFLVLIYGGDIPGGAGFVTMTGALALALVNMPQISLSKILKPAAASVAFAGFLYIFVMPQLSSFLELGLLIFVVTFTICYLFAAPQQMLGRAFGLAMFVTIASISNQQSYSFLTVATTALMFPMLFVILMITTYFPFDLRPQQVFLRLLDRYFRSSEYLILTAGLNSSQMETRMDGWRKMFHLHEVATLPGKLGVWLPHIEISEFSDTSQVQLQGLVTCMQSLSYRLQQLLDEYSVTQTHFMAEELREDFDAWGIGMQTSLKCLAKGPTIEEREVLCNGLDQMLNKLETRIKDIINKTPGEHYSKQDAENFYRLLGAYRSISEALVDYVRNAVDIDWDSWREARFA